MLNEIDNRLTMFHDWIDDIIGQGLIVIIWNGWNLFSIKKTHYNIELLGLLERMLELLLLLFLIE